MRILMGLNAPWVGGTRIHAIELAQALQARGHGIILVTDGGILEEEMSARGIRFVRRVDGLQDMLAMMLAVIEKEAIDLIHAHPAASILEGCLAAALTGLPLVVTMHGEYLMHFRRDELGRAMSRIVSKVIAVSESVSDHLARHSSIPPEKLLVVPNGIDTNAYRPEIAPNSARTELGLEPGEPVLLYLGRLDADKEAAILATATAARLLADYGLPAKAVYVGTGNLAPRLAELSRNIRAGTGRETIVLTGFRRDLPGLIAAADMVVAAGRSALESLAAGKPVFAAGRAGGLGLVTEDNWRLALETNFGDHGSLPPPDPVAMADTLHYLHGRAELRAKLGADLRQLVAAGFDLQKTAADLERVYEAAANSKERRQS